MRHIKEWQMVLPGLFVEYLVIGSMSLIWVLPLFNVGLLSDDSISIGKAAALAPAIYVLGMAVQQVSNSAMSYLPSRERSLKQRARRAALRNSPDLMTREGNVFASGPGRGARGRVLLYLIEPDMVREIEMRSSRDRIARGTVLNLALLWAVFSLGWVQLDGTVAGSLRPVLQHAIFAVLLALSIVVSMRFEGESYLFELNVGEVLLDRGINPRMLTPETAPGVSRHQEIAA